MRKRNLFENFPLNCIKLLMETLPLLRQIFQSFQYLDYLATRGRRVIFHTSIKLWMNATFNRVPFKRYKPRFRFPGRESYAAKYLKANKTKSKNKSPAENGAPLPPGSIDEHLPKCKDKHVCIQCDTELKDGGCLVKHLRRHHPALLARLNDKT